MIKMCKEYINLQTKEVLDMEIVETLKDNAMLKVKPELWEIWDFEKNDKLGLDIYKITKSPKGKAWWYCSKCNDSYPQLISSKVRGFGCLICTGKYVTKVNCLASTNPKLIPLLAHIDDAYRYTKSSEAKIDWKYPDCQEIIKNKRISDINKRGLSCTICSDGVKFPEKVMYHLLSQLELDFQYDKAMYFSENKRYDFYLPEHNLIIETHGGQHYKQGFVGVGGRNLQEEQENDKLKERLAKENGIDYIVIDCRKSELD